MSEANLWKGSDMRVPEIIFGSADGVEHVVIKVCLACVSWWLPQVGLMSAELPEENLSAKSTKLVLSQVLTMEF